MNPTPEANREQSALWNGTGARAWVETQQVMDQMFEPMERLLVEPLSGTRSSAVLDIGCGTGSTTLAAARRLGAQVRCVGLDISAPMIEMARARAAREGLPVSFVAADAQVHRFEPAGFDTLISRFGVMFFDDPVAAFTNLGQAARPGARLHFTAWRSADENPFMTTAERAAAPLLPDLPVRRPGAPGQFAFADRERVAAILQDSGWTGVEIAPIDFTCTMPTHELPNYIRWMGPVGQLLQKADDATRDRVGSAVRAAFERFVQGAEVRFTAACWSVKAVRR
jgi:SAM-dependent methyltransferase